MTSRAPTFPLLLPRYVPSVLQRKKKKKKAIQFFLIPSDFGDSTRATNHRAVRFPRTTRSQCVSHFKGTMFYQRRARDKTSVHLLIMRSKVFFLYPELPIRSEKQQDSKAGVNHPNRQSQNWNCCVLVWTEVRIFVMRQKPSAQLSSTHIVFSGWRMGVGWGGGGVGRVVLGGWQPKGMETTSTRERENKAHKQSSCKKEKQAKTLFSLSWVMEYMHCIFIIQQRHRNIYIGQPKDNIWSPRS